MRSFALCRKLLACSALTLVLSLAPDALAAGASVTAASEEQKSAAQAAYLSAMEKSNVGDHEAALAGFRASHDIVASPNSRLMVSRSLASLGRFAEAYREAQATESLARQAAALDPKYETSRTQAESDLRELRDKVGFVRIDASQKSAGSVLVAGRKLEAGELGAPVAVMPGEVSVVFSSATGDDTKSVTVAAGQEMAVVFTADVAAPPPTEPTPPASSSMHPFDGGDGQRITAAAVGGVGVVGMVLFGVFGGLHLSQFGDLEDQCPGGRCPAALSADADTGRTYQTAANVSLAVGIIGLAGGAALFLPTLIAADDASDASVSLVVSPTGLGLRGRY